VTRRREPWIVQARAPRGPEGPVRRLDAPEEIAPFLADAAHYPGGHAPAVCFPRSEAEVARVLREAARVLVVGAQSSLTGGATPRGETVLSTARMAEIGGWTAEGVVVGPGVVLADLERELRARGLYYPPVPTYDGATVGGTVATNAAGAATFKYGTTRDWVRGLTVVLADGDVLELRRGDATASAEGHFAIAGTGGTPRRLEAPRYRMPDVSKLSSGYFARPGMDLIDLFIGSEGTLGVVTAVELRLLPERPRWLAGLVPVAGDAEALRLVEALRAASRATWARRDPRGIDVAACEYMDRRALELAREDGAGARAGVPPPAGCGAAVLFQAEVGAGAGEALAYEQLGRLDDPSLDGPLVRLGRLLRDLGVLEATVPALPGDEARRAALFALREAVPAAVNRRVREAQRTVDPSISKSGGDVIVPFERLGEALGAWRTALASRGLDHAFWGHLSDGNLHPNALPRSADEMRRAREAQLEIGRIAIALGGAPMSEHGTGRNPVKKALLRALYGEAGLAAMRAVKRALDPRGVLAPGVVFDAAP
jgi:D-lactate dehydrogenase (cytochrome)